MGVSSWNYRVVRKDGRLGVHSAYYDESGKIEGLSIDPCSPQADSIEELEANLQLMVESLRSAIVDFDSVANGKWRREFVRDCSISSGSEASENVCLPKSEDYPSVSK